MTPAVLVLLIAATSADAAPSRVPQTAALIEMHRRNVREPNTPAEDRVWAEFLARMKKR